MLFILGLILGGGVVVFALQNVTPVAVTFLNWHMDGTLAWVLVLAVLVGMLISILVSLPGAIRDRMTLSKLHNRNKKLEEDLEKHKALLAKTQGALENTPVIEKTTIIETKS